MSDTPSTPAPIDLAAATALQAKYAAERVKVRDATRAAWEASGKAVVEGVGDDRDRA